MTKKLSNLEIIEIIEKNIVHSINLLNSLKNKNLSENDFEQTKQILLSYTNKFSNNISSLEKE